ncbi:MAG: hypothetical protein ACRYFZ_09450 [Janthinobacterium lividum]
MNKSSAFGYAAIGLIVLGFLGFGLGQWISSPDTGADYYGGGQVGGPLGCLVGLIVGFVYGATRKL